MADGKRARGRPTKLTPEVTDLICKLLRAGNYRQVAAEAAGISRNTFTQWMSGTRPHHKAFAAAVDAAEAEAQATLVTRIHLQSKHSWRAAAWLLERRDPEHWAAISDRRKLDGDGDTDEDPNPLAQFDDELAARRAAR